MVDWGHIISSLNKLDAGSDEKILLMSRDEKNLLVVTFAGPCAPELRPRADASPPGGASPRSAPAVTRARCIPPAVARRRPRRPVSGDGPLPPASGTPQPYTACAICAHG